MHDGVTLADVDRVSWSTTARPTCRGPRRSAQAAQDAFKRQAKDIQVTLRDQRVPLRRSPEDWPYGSGEHGLGLGEHGGLVDPGVDLVPVPTGEHALPVQLVADDAVGPVEHVTLARWSRSRLPLTSSMNGARCLAER